MDETKSKAAAFCEVLNAFGEVLDHPSSENRDALDQSVAAVVGRLDDADVDYLLGALDALAEHVDRREGAGPRNRFIEGTRDLHKR